MFFRGFHNTTALKRDKTETEKIAVIKSFGRTFMDIKAPTTTIDNPRKNSTKVAKPKKMISATRSKIPKKSKSCEILKNESIFSIYLFFLYLGKPFN
jgi:hypothetical protein